MIYVGQFLCGKTGQGLMLWKKVGTIDLSGSKVICGLALLFAQVGKC